MVRLMEKKRPSQRVDREKNKHFNTICRVSAIYDKSNILDHWGDFPGGPVVKTLCFQGRGRGLDPWSGH